MATASGTTAAGGGGGVAAPIVDADLVRRAQQGDRAAFGQWVVATQDRLYTVILRIVGDRDEARELCQETYLKALTNLAGFRGQANPYTWLFRIGVNLAISSLRRVRRARTFSLDGNGASDQAANLVARVAGGGDAMLDHERDREVLAALGRLDAEYRAVLVMRDVEGMDYQQIADVLELALGTVKSRLFRARAALRVELEGYFGRQSR